MPIKRISFTPPNGTRFMMTAIPGSAELEFDTRQTEEVLRWLRNTLHSYENIAIGVKPSVPITPVAAVRPIPKDEPLPPPPGNVLLVDDAKPIPMPEAGTWDLLRKIVVQAARVWPICLERGHLAINDLQSIFMDLETGAPKEMWYAKKLPEPSKVISMPVKGLKTS